jgi:hypothetical protein
MKVALENNRILYSSKPPPIGLRRRLNVTLQSGGRKKTAGVATSRFLS